MHTYMVGGAYQYTHVSMCIKRVIFEFARPQVFGPMAVLVGRLCIIQSLYTVHREILATIKFGEIA